MLLSMDWSFAGVSSARREVVERSSGVRDLFPGSRPPSLIWAFSSRMKRRTPARRLALVSAIRSPATARFGLRTAGSSALGSKLDGLVHQQRMPRFFARPTAAFQNAERAS